MTRKKNSKKSGGNLCAEFRGCSDKMLDLCQAYQKTKNCWDVEIKPCCRRADFERCQNCEIFTALSPMLATQTRTTSCEECSKLISYSTSRPKRCYQCRKKLANRRQLNYYYQKKKTKKGNEI
ncbi:MAG: hypothetical protein QGH40_07705 [bacterium]|nr:hypothetical protein [bacterium]